MPLPLQKDDGTFPTVERTCYTRVFCRTLRTLPATRSFILCKGKEGKWNRASSPHWACFSWGSPPGKGDSFSLSPSVCSQEIVESKGSLAYNIKNEKNWIKLTKGLGKSWSADFPGVWFVYLSYLYDLMHHRSFSSAFRLQTCFKEREWSAALFRLSSKTFLSNSVPTPHTFILPPPPVINIDGQPDSSGGQNPLQDHSLSPCYHCNRFRRGPPLPWHGREGKWIHEARPRVFSTLLLPPFCPSSFSSTYKASFKLSAPHDWEDLFSARTGNLMRNSFSFIKSARTRSDRKLANTFLECPLKSIH